MRELTHAQLVKRAGGWLRRIGCKVVMEEFTAYTKSGEIPDAVGWIYQRCILIECKRTRADFLSDKRKRARQDGARALGAYRFYFAPPGIIKESDLPDGWGLYEVHDKQIRPAGGMTYPNAASIPFLSDRESEVGLLLSALRRLEISTCVFVRQTDDAETENSRTSTPDPSIEGPPNVMGHAAYGPYPPGHPDAGDAEPKGGTPDA